jgi:NUMOD1 domain
MRPDITRVAYLLSPLRDNPIPIYVYDSTGSNLLYLFISKTILHTDFNISHRTLRVHLNTGVLYLNLFLLSTSPSSSITCPRRRGRSTELLKTASGDNMLTLEQLPPPPSTYFKYAGGGGLKMKNDHKSSSFLNSYNKTKARPIHLIHTIKPELSKKCRSLTDAAIYIKEIDGTGDRGQMRQILN